jgi:hypothetical protein
VVLLVELAHVVHRGIVALTHIPFAATRRAELVVVLRLVERPSLIHGARARWIWAWAMAVAVAMGEGVARMEAVYSP